MISSPAYTESFLIHFYIGKFVYLLFSSCFLCVILSFILCFGYIILNVSLAFKPTAMAHLVLLGRFTGLVSVIWVS